MLLKRAVLSAVAVLPLLMACSDPASPEVRALLGTWELRPDTRRVDRSVMEFTRLGTVMYSRVLDLEPYGVDETSIFVSEGRYLVRGDSIDFVWNRMTAYYGSVPPEVYEPGPDLLRDARFEINARQLRLRYNAPSPNDGVVAAELVLERER